MVRKGQCRLFQEHFFDFGEGNLVVYRPLPLGILVGEGQEGFSEVRKSRYGFLIKIAKSDEGLDCFYINGGGSVLDGL